jgi:hypothetical protein
MIRCVDAPVYGNDDDGVVVLEVVKSECLFWFQQLPIKDEIRGDAIALRGH